MTDQPFGFKVKAPYRYDVYGDGKQIVDYHWRVALPHQCDDWEITSDYHGQPQPEAIAQMERFIAEAQQALTALREGRAFDAEEQP
jgi:hypothetical protein